MDAEIDRWYHRKRWKTRAAHQLKIEPLCRMCKERGKIEPACVVDHVERHNGDLVKFVFGDVQSLCIDCHNRTSSRSKCSVTRATSGLMASRLIGVIRSGRHEPA